MDVYLCDTSHSSVSRGTLARRRPSQAHASAPTAFVHMATTQTSVSGRKRSFQFISATAASTSAASLRSAQPIIVPGEPIPVEPGFLRGHGTLVCADGTLVATLAGVVERVDKLVSVRPLRSSRYVGEVGDVVVGRILEVGQKRWKVDVGGRQDSVLMLSSINLPGGEQRRRTAEDQLNMRQFFVEHDLVSAEVQAFFQDGSMSLHTRSLMYGKLHNGVLVRITPTLMKRLKQHFHAFDFGIHVIFGMNGFVWISARRPGSLVSNPDDEVAAAAEAAAGINGRGGESAGGAADVDPAAPLSTEERERVCRVRNALLALDQLCIAVSPSSLAEVYHASLTAGHAPKAMLLPSVQAEICAPILERGGVDAPAAEKSVGDDA